MMRTRIPKATINSTLRMASFQLHSAARTVSHIGTLTNVSRPSTSRRLPAIRLKSSLICSLK